MIPMFLQLLENIEEKFQGLYIELHSFSLNFRLKWKDIKFLWSPP